MAGINGIPPCHEQSATSRIPGSFSYQDSSLLCFGSTGHPFPTNAMFNQRPINVPPFNQVSTHHIPPTSTSVLPDPVACSFGGHSHQSPGGVFGNQYWSATQNNDKKDADISVILRFGVHESCGSLSLSQIYDFANKKFIASEERAREIGVVGVDCCFRSDANSFGEHAIFEFTRKLAPGFDQLPSAVRSAIEERVTKNYTMLKFVVNNCELFGGVPGSLLENHITSVIHTKKYTDLPVVIVVFEKDHSDKIFEDFKTPSPTKNEPPNQKDSRDNDNYPSGYNSPSERCQRLA